MTASIVIASAMLGLWFVAIIVSEILAELRRRRIRRVLRAMGLSDPLTLADFSETPGGPEKNLGGERRAS